MTKKFVHRTSSSGWLTPCGIKIANLDWWMYIKKPVTTREKEEIISSNHKFLCDECFDVKYRHIRMDVNL